jgi:hypothetical protein
MDKSGRLSPIELGIGVVGVAVVALAISAVALTLRYLAKNNDSATQEFSSADSKDKDHVAVDVKLISIDPVKGDLVARLQFAPEGGLLAEDGNSLKRTLVLDLNSATGKAQQIFKKGEPMNPTDVTVSLYGDATDYPFDTHEGELVLSLYAQAPEPKPKPAPAADGDAAEPPAPAEEEEAPDVAAVVTFTAALTGYTIDAKESSYSQTTEGYTDIELTVSRSTPVKAFSLFVIVLQWLLASCTIFAMVTLVIRQRKLEAGFLSWLAGLLFALPPLRNAQFAVPPLGTLSDVVSFFWVEAIVALCMVVVVYTWAVRVPK